MATTAEPKATATAVAAAWKFKPADRNDLRRAEEVVARWVYWIDPDVPAEALEDSDFWRNVGDRLHPGDEIIAKYDDMSAEADLRVLSAGHGWARVHLVALHRFPTTIADEAADFDDAYLIEHGGPSSLYIVVRKLDGQVLSKGHPNRQAAVAWLMAHLAQKAQEK